MKPEITDEDYACFHELITRARNGEQLSTYERMKLREISAKWAKVFAAPSPKK